MKLKKLFIVSVLSVCMLFAFTITTSRDSEAATMPQLLFSEGTITIPLLYFAVAELGPFMGNEWEIFVMNYADMSSSFGIGMRFFNPTWNEFGMTVLSDDTWPAFGIYGEWTGSGSLGYLSSVGTQDVVALTTTPPPAREGSETRSLLRSER